MTLRSMYIWISYLFTTTAVYLRGGGFAWDVFFLLMAGLVFFLMSFRRGRSVDSLTAQRLVLGGILILGALVMLRSPGTFLGQTPFWILLRLLIPFVILAAIGIGRGRTRLWIPAVALLIAIGALIPHFVPDPQIDVWVVIQNAARALWAGQNPYALPHPQLSNAYYFEHGYNYPPLLLPLYALIVAVTGDTRFTTVVALVLTAMILYRWLGKSLQKPLIALLVLGYFMNPLHWTIIEKDWTEGPVAALLIASVWQLSRSPQSFSSYLTTILMISSKQYLVLLSPFLKRLLPSWRRVSLAIGVALIPVILFVAWGPQAFYREVIHFFFHYPPRGDSLSLFGLVFRSTGMALPVWVTLLPFSITAIIFWIRNPRTLPDVLHWMTLGMFMLFITGCSFANYYYLLNTLLWLFCLVDTLITDGKPRPL